MLETRNPSYKKVHYGLRVAKHIERKMLAEAFRRLTAFAALDEYRYIGLGSIYFTDFILFHKLLGIRNMVSIERQVNDKDRFDFNRPYGCISMSYGDSSEQLPAMPWDEKTILWLDYDDPLESSHLDDVDVFCASAPPGSVLIVSINVHPNGRGNPDWVEELRGRVGDLWLPDGLAKDDLRDEGLGIISRNILIEAIHNSLSKRNGVLKNDEKLELKQIFHFRYKDGAMMLTFGGVLIEQRQGEMLATCQFDALHFIRPGNDFYHINPPNLTYRELRHLDAQLPCADLSVLSAHGITLQEIEKYAEVYRYYPTYAEAEI